MLLSPRQNQITGLPSFQSASNFLLSSSPMLVEAARHLFADMFHRGQAFWNRHKRKLVISLGVLGSGYLIYRVLESTFQRRRMLRGGNGNTTPTADQLIREKLQEHFENIQKISDTTTLPGAIRKLQSRVDEMLDLVHVTERLQQLKQPGRFMRAEKIELWMSLKFLSFTRAIVSLWVITMLSLYVRVQVNILGKHLYLKLAEAPNGLPSPLSDKGLKNFLETADYLPVYGINSLIMNMRNATVEILTEKQLHESFNIEQLRETVLQILDLFMSIGGEGYWINYLMPQSAVAYSQMVSLSLGSYDGSLDQMDVDKVEQLLSETRLVLESSEYKNIVEISLKKATELLVDDIQLQFSEVSAAAVAAAAAVGVPLVKLLPQMVDVAQKMLEDANVSSFAWTIRRIPEVELFYALLYANMPRET